MPTASSTIHLASRRQLPWNTLAIIWLICAPQAGAAVPLANSSPRSAARATQPSLRKLCAEIQTTSVDRRVIALRKMAAMGPAAGKAVPDIIEVLTDNRSFGGAGGFAHRISPEVTDAAIDALTAIGPAAAGASPYLVTILADRSDLMRRSQVLVALAAIGADNSATKTVMRIVGEEAKATATHVEAIKLLGKIDPPALEALDLLKQIAEDKSDPASRKAALQAITSIDERTRRADAKKPTPQSAQQSKILLQLGTDDKHQKLAALESINDLGADGAPFVPRLMLLLKDGDPDLNSAALDALSNIGPAATAAAPALVAQLMTERDSDRRGELCRALTLIDPVGKLSIPLLRPALEDPFKARTAIELLDRLGTDQAAEIAAASRKRWCIK